MQQIVQRLQEWKWLNTLPADIEGFSLVNELMQCDTQYRIFTYQQVERQRSFSVLYDQATKEYLVRVVVGLTEYVDISFIVADLVKLEAVLQQRMEPTIHRLANFNENSLCTVFREKNILQWPYAKSLPAKIAGFSLYIAPYEPLKTLNGSYIIIDYTDFVAESSFLVYYNIYRDEFFGELRIRRAPQMINSFDSKTLPNLEQCLITHLKPTLENLRKHLSE